MWEQSARTLHVASPCDLWLASKCEHPKRESQAEAVSSVLPIHATPLSEQSQLRPDARGANIKPTSQGKTVRTCCLETI